MKVCVIGNSFAPRTFRKAWGQFFKIVQKAQDADLVFISSDTEIGENGERDQESLRGLIHSVYADAKIVILTSQVEPGFTRSLGLPIYHLAETLRIKDAPYRALHPDYFALGCPDPTVTLPVEIQQFVMAFETVEVIKCTWEEAEFSKIAVNMTLAAQVDNTNRLAKAAKAVGADWRTISYILGKDKRIGSQSYLTPGDWRQSKHLLRDAYTLERIENEWNQE